LKKKNPEPKPPEPKKPTQKTRDNCPCCLTPTCPVKGGGRVCLGCNRTWKSTADYMRAKLEAHNSAVEASRRKS